MTLDEFDNEVKNMILAIPKEMSQINILMAQTAIPLITNRLINEGKTAEGKSLGEYSNKPISPLFFIGKGLGSGADKKVLDYTKKNKVGISYKTFRELNGRPTNHVTLSFTGETLGDVAVLQTIENGLKIKTIVGSNDRHKKDIVNKKGKKTGTIGTRDNLENLNNKYGMALDTDLLGLSKEESEDLQVIYESGLQKLINKYLK